VIDVPAEFRAMAERGPEWAAWVDEVPGVAKVLVEQWRLRTDGYPTHGHSSLILPVRTAEGAAAILKLGFPDEESEHEHLALQRWGGCGAVRLLSADPHHRGLLLERLSSTDLSTVSDAEACGVVTDLYRRIHVPAMPQLRPLSYFINTWTAELAGLARNAPIPRRLVEQAIALGKDLVADRAVADRVIHTDLHYGNVLAGNVLAGNVLAGNVLAGNVLAGSVLAGNVLAANVPAAEREPWLVIDPKPVNGDPHYEIAPMLWNRWDEIAGDVRDGVRRRLWTLVDAAGFDEDRARAWVIVRMVHNAMWALGKKLVRDGPQTDPAWLTICVAVAKAVQD
jgi:streptomycin 6-kinase